MQSMIGVSSIHTDNKMIVWKFTKLWRTDKVSFEVPSPILICIANRETIKDFESN